jgi:serine protease Do
MKTNVLKKQAKTIKRIFSLVAFVAFLSISSGQSAQAQTAGKGPQDFSEIVAPLLPSVVNISTTTEIKRDRQSFGIPNFPQGSQLEDLFRQFFEGHPEFDMPRKATSLGSGFVVAREGKEIYIVTCNHVIEGADAIKVILHNDEEELKAIVVGRDRRTDLALLKVKTDKKVSIAEWAEMKDVKVGQWVIAVGNPFGLSSTVTIGIISTIARNIAARARGLASADYVEGYIQTDASINMGNSGGPQFNVQGKVIAISTAIFSPNGGNIGIGFGIPADIAKKVIEQLKKFGQTQRGWLGVRIQPITDSMAPSLGLDKVKGALIAEVSPKGPAAKAGIKAGDVIIKFNGIEVKESRQLPHIVGDSPIGKKVPMLVARNGKEMEFDVMVGRFEEAESAGLLGAPDMEEKMPLKKEKKILGLILKSLTPALIDTLRLPEGTKGVLVEAVDPRSETARIIFPGDVIMEMRFKKESSPIASPKDVEDFITKVIKNYPPEPATEDDKNPEKEVLFFINRKGATFFIGVKVSDDALNEKSSKKKGKDKSSSNDSRDEEENLGALEKSKKEQLG